MAPIVEDNQVVGFKLWSKAGHVATFWWPGLDIDAKKAGLLQNLFNQWTADKPAMVALPIKK